VKAGGSPSGRVVGSPPPTGEAPTIEARWEWDVLKDRVNWSAELYEIYGLEPREFRPSYDAYLQRVHPDDRKRIRLIVGQALRDGRPFDFEHRVLRPDGSLRFVVAHGEVERDQHGNVLRMWGTTRDITRERQHDRRKSDRRMSD
jgi:PAS domain S-box-containing protein